MIEEGYIKYHIDWTFTPPSTGDLWVELDRWRTKMHSQGLIGYYPDLGVGYGNISVRCEAIQGKFLISGTQTGHLPQLSADDYSLVTDYDLEKNSLTCEGPVKASSESLTHAAIYELSSDYQAVIHAHHKGFWDHYLDKIPTTSINAAYGTPEMANEIFRLYEESELRSTKICVMGGHDEGIISFGKNLDEAGAILQHYFDELKK